jgi:hypothetical protein
LQLQHFLGNNRIWANPDSLWKCLETYVEKYRTEEEKKAFLKALGSAMQPKSCPQFCDLLKDKGALSEKQWFDLNTERAKLRNYANPPRKIKKATETLYTYGHDGEFTLLSPEGIECTFAYKQNVSDIRQGEKEISCYLTYIEGPPCNVKIQRTYEGSIFSDKPNQLMTEGKKQLVSCTTLRHDYIAKNSPKIEFTVELWDY